MMSDKDSEPESSVYNTRSSFSIQQLQNHLGRYHTDTQPAEGIGWISVWYQGDQ